MSNGVTIECDHEGTAVISTIRVAPGFDQVIIDVVFPDGNLERAVLVVSRARAMADALLAAAATVEASLAEFAREQSESGGNPAK